MAQGKTLPDDLIQYVRKAEKAGLAQNQILQEATNQGWPAAMVTEAIAYASSQPVTTAEAAANEPKASPAGPTATPTPLAPAKVDPASPGADVKEARAKAEAANDSLPYDYHIGAGDVLQISVWKEADASTPSVVVRPDGKISMPLVKEVQVGGLTPKEAEKLITFRLSKMISEPDVTVVVTGIHSQKVYAVGSVRKEGPIAYTYRMNIMQAISEAGGLTDYAKRKKIYILRTENGKEQKLPFDYDSALKGNMALNIQLMPGDTLVVP